MRDHMDPVLGRALEREYSDLVAAAHRTDSRPASVSRRPVNRTAFVTAVVAVVVAIVAALVIHAGRPTTSPAIAPTSSTTVLGSDALLKKLPKQSYGRTIHTWTDQDTSNPSGPFTLTGSTAVIASVCTGGGAISVTAPDRPARKLSCAKLDIQQPGWKFNLGGDGKATTETKPVRVSVTVLSGTPHYVVRLWAVDPRILDADKVSIAPTSTTVPASLRSCTTLDLAPRATFDWLPRRSSGVVTISGRNTTDCAIRSWPVMRYLNAAGGQIGPAQGIDDNGKSLDSSEGVFDRYGQFPPARLAAGGQAFLIMDLSTEAQLTQEDVEQTARPTPTTGPSISMPLCEPEQVRSIRLSIGSAAVTVTAPSSPIPAACRTSSRAFGVDPVVTKRPAFR